LKGKKVAKKTTIKPTVVETDNIIETGLTYMGKKVVLVADGNSDEMAERAIKQVVIRSLNYFRSIDMRFDRVRK